MTVTPLAPDHELEPVDDFRERARRWLAEAMPPVTDGWNDRRRPFAWTKTAADILKKANRQNTSNTDN